MYGAPSPQVWPVLASILVQLAKARLGLSRLGQPSAPSAERPGAGMDRGDPVEEDRSSGAEEPGPSQGAREGEPRVGTCCRCA